MNRPPESEGASTIHEMPAVPEALEAEVRRLLADVLRHVRPADAVVREILSRTKWMLGKLEAGKR